MKTFNRANLPKEIKYNSYPSNYEGDRFHTITSEGNYTNTVNMELQSGDLISFEAKNVVIQPVKRFYLQYNVGNIKYLVKYHTGETKHKDGSDFFSIIDFYESHPEEYNRIVNRNYELLMERHTWSNRLESMIEIIEKECFK